MKRPTFSRFQQFGLILHLAFTNHFFLSAMALCAVASQIEQQSTGISSVIRAENVQVSGNLRPTNAFTSFSSKERSDVGGQQNATVFIREDALKKLSERLRAGMTTQEVVQAIGSPTSIYRWVSNGAEISQQTISLEEQNQAHSNVYWLYSPNFDDSHVWNGVLYHELTLEFDPTVRVKNMVWTTAPFSPRMKIRRSEVAQ